MIDFMLVDDFQFKHNFLNLTDEQLSKALQMVNAQFSGVYSLWTTFVFILFISYKGRT